jgi:NADPH:quinone reductase-like Zn-dependent oxidoreductase
VRKDHLHSWLNRLATDSEKMKAISIANYGPVDEIIRTTAMPKPRPGAQDILVQVCAAGVNPIDWKIAEGYMRGTRPFSMPLILGNEVAGVVTTVGGESAGFKNGDEVYVRLDPAKCGAFAEFVAVDAKLAALKPKKVDFTAAAGIPLAGLTAWQVLFEHLKLEKGQKILIQAGSGGVGSFAIQFANHIGAEVATTVGPDGVDMARALGAKYVIDYKSQRFEDVVKDFDAVFDTLGGETQARSLRVLKRGGTLITLVGITADPDIAEKLGVSLQGIAMHPDGKQLGEIAGLVDAGAVKPIIDRTFDFDQAKQALIYSKSGRAKGKIVIKIS